MINMNQQMKLPLVKTNKIHIECKYKNISLKIRNFWGPAKSGKNS